MKFIIRTILLTALLLNCFSAHAVYVERMPVFRVQPNGDTVRFFVTGDECYHRYHDAQNYTIVQAVSGWWVYAVPSPAGGVQPSAHPVGTLNPASLGVAPGLDITYDQWLEHRKYWEIPEQYRIEKPKTSGRNHGDFCNLIIFIRFADDTPYSRPLSNVDYMFSDSSSESSTSVYNYFKHASYNKLFVRTYYAPQPDGDNILSYRCPHPRDYFMPYTEYNTIGYTNDDSRREREFELIVGAVNYINDSAPIPSNIVLDCNNDGEIDNVNFVVKGPAAGWSDLLWPHKWNLYGREVYINNKRVSTFNLALEGSGDSYFGTSTFCHEMFHSLGAPDLYRYNRGTDISPVGPWDLMATNSRPPQHMSAYMKYKYGNWLDSIPLVATPGTYTLHSVADSAPGNVAYRFPSSDPDQFYVVEYRDNEETFETTLPGKGLLVYRIDTRFEGNAGYNGRDHFDEIWLFRPNSNSNTENGLISNAYFTPRRSRSQFTPSGAIYPYLTDGTPDPTFSITKISTPGDSITFYYSNYPRPARLQIERITTSTITLSWIGNFEAYNIYYRPNGSNENFLHQTVSSPHITLSNLSSNTLYDIKIAGLYNHDGNTYRDTSDFTNTSVTTQICNNATSLQIDLNQEVERTGIPYANGEDYNYSQQIFLASELEGAMTISSFKIYYNSTQEISKKKCTVYMANTSLANFNDSTPLMPVTQLTNVFEGKIEYKQGWNEIILNAPFYYNGTDNLLLAIDDNSGTRTYIGQKFFTHNTDDIMSYVYHSTSPDPDPYADTINGTQSRNRYRNNIVFTGCPDNGDKVYACIIADNDTRGRVTGQGLYNRNEVINSHAYPKVGFRFMKWQDESTENPRSVILTQDTVFVAYFGTPLGINDASQTSGYLILTRYHELTIQGVEGQPVFVYDLLGRTVAQSETRQTSNVTLKVPQTGIYIVRIGDNKPVKLFIQ